MSLRIDTGLVLEVLLDGFGWIDDVVEFTIESYGFITEFRGEEYVHSIGHPTVAFALKSNSLGHVAGPLTSILAVKYDRG